MASTAEGRDRRLRRIRLILKRYARELGKEIRVKSLILFGSHARGSGREDSDIDVAVISEDLSGNLLEDDLLVMRARRNVDLRIEPHPFRPEDFRDENPLVWEIKRRGVVII